VHRLTLIALGGNALIRRGEAGTLDQQRAHIEESVAPIARVAAAGMPLIITHGNGPIVGQLLLQGELAKAEVPLMPLHIMDAESQGSVGFLLQQALSNHLLIADIAREVVTVVTRVVVDATDPSFASPSKPVGVFHERHEAERLSRERGWCMEEDSGRGWRRRVASPVPLWIPEAQVIAGLASRGVVTIAAGGGGVPVVQNEDGTLEGVDAVVDKDRASALLGIQAGAERLVILTSVDAVYAGFGTPSQRTLDRVTASQAERLLAAEEFAPGSMGPKIEAAVVFLRRGGREVRVGLPEQMDALLAGRAGTVLLPG